MVELSLIATGCLVAIYLFERWREGREQRRRFDASTPIGDRLDRYGPASIEDLKAALEERTQRA